MSCLVIFDSSTSAEDMNSLSLRGEGSAMLFPLTSKQHILSSVRDKCYAEDIKRVETIETGQLINESADEIRNRYIEFIATLPGRFRINGKNLKEWFYYPDGGISLWWLSLVAEKNTFKSDSFNRLVQLYAVIRVIEEHKVKKIALSCASNKLKSALNLYCKENSLSLILLPNSQERDIIRKLLDKCPTIKALAGAYLYMANQLMKWLHMKYFLKAGLESRLNTNINSPLLFITYYPNIDTELAARGIFKNKYYLQLQEESEKEGRDIIWVAMYVHNTTISFRESLQYARRFIANGYHLVFLEEFLTLGSFVRIFRNTIRSLVKFKSIEKKLPDGHYFSGGIPVYPIFREDWLDSFCGVTSAQAFLYLEAFKNMFKQLKGIQKGVYYCEMHAWEKALLAAKKWHAADMELFGYQHATVSRMLLNYFNHPSELEDTDSDYAIPKPSKIACNGELPCNYFRESGWREDELTVVEALRYSHLGEGVEYVRKVKDNIILVAFSIGVEESIAVLNMVYTALKEATNIKVWLKPHPFLPMDLVLRESEILLRDVYFEIKAGQIEELLPYVKAVIVNESGVALEALAYGCRIISVNIPDMVNMSPLRGIKSNLIRYASSPEQLQRVVDELVAENEESNPEEIKELIDQFFYFNKNSVKPERFLSLLS